ETTRIIREKYNMPIIFLSAKTSDFDKVQGLVIGADDYMTKPFTPIELVARVNAQLRRFKNLINLFKKQKRISYLYTVDYKLIKIKEKFLSMMKVLNSRLKSLIFYIY